MPWGVSCQAPLSMGSPRQEYWKWKWKALSHVPFFETPWTVYSPLNSPGQNTEVSRVSYSRGTSLLQKNPPGDLPNPGIQPRPRSIVHGVAKSRTRLSDFHLRILEWISISFSRGSSQPRDQIRVSCIAGRFFTIKVTRENLFRKYSVLELNLTFPGNNLITHQTFCHCTLCVIRTDYKGFWPYKEVILNIQFTQDTVREIRKLRKR